MILHLIQAHFDRYRRKDPWEFCWKLALEGVVVSFVLLIPIVIFSKIENREMMEMPPLELLLFAVAFVPVIETLILQVIPITIARWFRAGFYGEILASLVPFAALHFYESFAVGLAAGLVGGFYLAFSYAHWIRRSFWTAFWVTTVHHAIRNFVTIAPLVIASLLGPTG